jgi:hypothetical protein
VVGTKTPSWWKFRSGIFSSGTDMSVHELIDESALFGTHQDTNWHPGKTVVPRRRNRFEAERLLREARAEDPSCLPVYFALYEFYANAGRLNDAARASRPALSEAARQGGFHSDWEKLNAGPKPVDLDASDAGLFYLVSLKALAFIKLCQQPMADAKAILTHLRRLDREDRCGGSVIRTLAEAAGLSFQGRENE